MRWGSLCCGVICVVLGTVLATLHIAQAHDVALVRSVPVNESVIETLPTSMVAEFNEEIDPAHSALEVLDAQGAVVVQGTSRLDLSDIKHATLLISPAPSLSKGAYTVRWHVTVLDGDATEGQFGFVLGKDNLNSANSANAAQSTSRSQPWLLWSVLAAVVAGIAGGIFVIKSRRSVG